MLLKMLHLTQVPEFDFKFPAFLFFLQVILYAEEYIVIFFSIQINSFIYMN